MVERLEIGRPWKTSCQVKFLACGSLFFPSMFAASANRVAAAACARPWDWVRLHQRSSTCARRRWRFQAPMACSLAAQLVFCFPGTGQAAADLQAELTVHQDCAASRVAAEIASGSCALLPRAPKKFSPSIGDPRPPLRSAGVAPGAGSLLEGARFSGASVRVQGARSVGGVAGQVGPQG
jgi:hypothetical protein